MDYKEFHAELQGTINKLGEAFVEYRKELNKRVDDLEKFFSRGGLGGDRDLGNWGKPKIKEDLAAFLRTGSRPQGAMHSEDDTAGGFTVPEEINREILEVARKKTTLRRLARVVSGSPDYKQIASPTGPSTGWITERGTRSETTTPGLVAIDFIFGELYANAGIWNHLLADSLFDIAAWLIEQINNAFSLEENDVFLNGNGVGKPHGILQYDFTSDADADRGWGKLQYIASGVADNLTDADKLIQMLYALRPGYHDRAAWIMNPTTAELVRKFKDGEGRWLWSMLSEGQPPSLLGYPVNIDEHMPAIAAGSFPILFGNYFAGYTVVDHRAGLKLIRDNVTVKGETFFYVSRRVAGAVTDYHALKALKIAES